MEMLRRSSRKGLLLLVDSILFNTPGFVMIFVPVSDLAV